MARSPNDPIGSLLDVLTPAEKAQIPWINMPPGYGPQGGIPTDQSYRVAGDIPDANRNGQVPPINMPSEYGPAGRIQPLYQPPDVGGIRQMQQNVTGGIGKFLGIPDAIAALRGQMTPDEAQMFALGALPGLLPGARAEQVAAESAPAVARGIRAFHGSPHDFPAFDISKIGTGEGAQAYGHGLYFAENPAVAQSYKPDVSQTAAGDLSKDFPHLQGKMYEVNINADPEHFLDWDKPLSEQHPKVQDALTQSGLFPKGNMGVREFIDSHSKLTGDSLDNLGLDSAAISQKLHQAGIPGIKYLDQGSRTYFQVEPHEFLNGEQGFKVNGPKGDVTFDTKAEAQKFADGLNKGKSAPTYNYVVFDDKLIDIIKKYGIAGLIGAGASNWSPSGQK